MPLKIPEPLCLRAAGLAGAEESGPAAVLIQGGRVAALGEAALAAGAPEQDLGPLWLAPAPIDAHVHLILRGEPEANRAAWYEAGVAAVRDLGVTPRRSYPFGNDDVPPLVISSGPGLCARGPGSCWLAEELEGPEAFAAAARRRLAEGVHLIKIFATGLLDFARPGEVEHEEAVTQEEMAAAVEVAHAAGVPVAVHNSGIPAIRRALAAGVDAIEHGFFMDRPTLELLARSGASWSPTLAAVEIHAADPEGRHDSAMKESIGRIATMQAEALKLGDELGVNLVLGSDAGSYGLPNGPALQVEMASWLGAGVRPATVYAAATTRAAAALGLAGEVGGITPGARAWLLGVAGDPVQDPMLLARPQWRSF